MYSRVANDATSPRTDHPERTSRRLCRTSQPTLSSTSTVAGSDRAESTLGSRPPAPRALDGSTASTALARDHRSLVYPGIHAVPERVPSASALPAWPPQIHGWSSSRRTQTAATADASSRGDDRVEQGTSFLSFPLSAAAEDDVRSYTRRATYSSTEGGARVHPPITHPCGMEGVQPQMRTSPATYRHIAGDSRFEFEPAAAAAADDAHTGERQAGGPTGSVARPRYHTLAQPEARVVTLAACQQFYFTASTSRTAPLTATTRAPSEQEGDAPVYLSGTPQGQLRDAVGRDLKLRTRRALHSAMEGGARVHPSSTHPREVEGVAPQSRPPPSVANLPTLGHFHRSFEPVALADDSDSRAGLSPHSRSRSPAARFPSLALTAARTGPSSCNASSTAAAPRALPGQEDDVFVIPGSIPQDSRVAVIAESVGSAMRTVYDFGRKYITILPSTVTSVVQDLSRALAEEQRNARSPFTPRDTHASPPLLAGRQQRPALSLSAMRAPFAAPRSCSVDSIHCDDSLRSAVPHDTSLGDNYYCAQGPDTRRPLAGLPPSLYAADLYTADPLPSVAASAPRADGRSSPPGCDISYNFQSSPPSATMNNSLKSTSQRTPALEGGAGVLLPKSHPLAMEGASAEDVLPVYAETSAPGKDSRFALESWTPYGTAKAISEKHTQGARPNEKYTSLNAESEQWARNASPIAVHMFSRAAENPAARAVLQSVQGGSRRIGSTPQPPEVTQPAAVRNASGRAGRVRTRSSAQNDGHDEQSVSSSRGHDASRYERRARALRNAKLPMPTYDGCADLRRYEEFVFKWDSWIRNRDLGESDSVELMYNALTGEALEWYLSFVAMSDHPWTTREIYQELYEYCFPYNFREELRLQLMSARQDGRSVKRFAKDLQNLALRFSDVGQSTLKRVLWDGVDPYIRIFWVEKGRSAEYDDYDTLVLYAHRVERREAEIRRSLEGADAETELASPRDNNPEGDVMAHAVRMRHVAIRSQDLPTAGDDISPEGQGPDDPEEDPEYYSREEPDAENGDSHQYNAEYGDAGDEYYYSQDESESREHESQEYSQGEYYEDEYEEYGEAEHQPNEYGDGEYPYLDDEEEREEEGHDYYEEEGEEEGEYYDDEAGDEDEEDGHSGELPLNTGRNEYGEDEYNSEGSLYENEEEY